MSSNHDRRHLILEGAYNMRDLGHVSTTDGYKVRSGKLFRSDALHGLTSADLEQLGVLGIASVIDLRADEEITQMGKARLTDHGARHIHRPLVSRDPVVPTSSDFPENMGELYVTLALNGPDRFVRALEAIAMLENMPAVFHCAAGKDRTGMVTALLYSILGVAEDVIVADYVLTDANMDRFLAAEKQRGELPPDDLPAVPASYARAEALTITTFLNGLNEQFGSPVEWLKQHGIDDRLIEQFRREMLA